MDSFVEYLTTYWGKMSVDQTSIAMKLRLSTIQGWLNFISNFMMSRLQAGQSLPTQDEIVNEWHKDHPPAHYVATPYGDTAQPITASATPDNFIAELKLLMQRYNI